MSKPDLMRRSAWNLVPGRREELPFGMRFWMVEINRTRKQRRG